MIGISRGNVVLLNPPNATTLGTTAEVESGYPVGIPTVSTSLNSNQYPFTSYHPMDYASTNNIIWHLDHSGNEVTTNFDLEKLEVLLKMSLKKKRSKKIVLIGSS